MEKIRVGLYGNNGHQIQRKLVHHPDAELAALCMTKEAHLPDASVPVYSSLEDMLRDESLTLISLCSPRRADQAADAIACLNAGKHVYAEKPSALDENELERIFAAADAAGREFHEMADSIFYEPYWTVRSVVQSGKIGEVIQVYAQKSYPSRFDCRPQDEETDGGLIRWVGIHAVRFIEHITGIHVRDVRTYETHLGGPLKDDGIFTAASMAMSLENGGVASVVLNYLNPTGFPSWGNESVRVFGRRGMVELTDGGRRTHLYTDRDEGELEIPEVPCADYFDLLVRHLRFGSPFPLSRDDEFHPLRVVLRAKERAEKCEIR
ncbi:MAG: Gfo/Idh/MocA family protein [Eubacteriales bacterium]